MAAITGTDGSETLEGTAGADTIYGLGGSDRIDGKAGSDVIYGGSGDDNIQGGTGDDLIDGGDGNDYLSDDGGNDTLRGGAGDDSIRVGRNGSTIERVVVDAGSGNDSFTYQNYRPGSLVADMGDGDDRVDLIVMQDGGMRLTLGGGSDTISFNTLMNSYSSGTLVVTDFAAGSTGDRLEFSDWLNKTLVNWDGSANPFGMAGYLRLVQQGTTTLLQMDRDGATGGGGFATLVTFENTVASQFTTENFGSFAPRFISAADAATAFINAPVSVLEGNDTSIPLTLTLRNVSSATTSVSMSFSAANSTASNGSDVSVPSFSGSYTISQSPAGTYTIALPALSIFDDAVAEGDETIAVQIRASGFTFDNGSDTTIVRITLQDNDFAGTAANDVLLGTAGRDTLTGGAGDDRIDGGAGVDTAVFSGASSAYRLVYQGGGAVAVSGPDGTDTLVNVERLQFGNGTVSVPAGFFDTSVLATNTFGASAAAGGWSSAGAYPRVAVDVNGDGRADLAGFGEAGLYVSLANANGTYGAPVLVNRDFGRSASAGGWGSQDGTPRALADVNGDGRVDIVGFGNAGTYVSLARSDGSYGAITLASGDFGRDAGAGGWSSQESNARLLADVNGDGRADVVGFGNAGTYVALGNANGTFGALRLASGDFGRDASAGGWTGQDRYPRLLADVNGDGRADIVGFGNAGTYVALASANGTFGALRLATASFGADASAGGWTSAGVFPRAAADVNGDGRVDLVGFGTAGTYLALGDGQGGFGPLVLATAAFGTSASAGGWSSGDLFPRLLADTDGDGRADIVGFGDGGVYVATAAAFDAVAATTAGATPGAAGADVPGLDPAAFAPAAFDDHHPLAAIDPARVLPDMLLIA